MALVLDRDSKAGIATETARGIDQVTFRRRGTGLIAFDPDRSAGGYTLVAPQTDAGNVRLIAMDGETRHSWKMSTRPGRDAVLLANGNLGYNGSNPNSPHLYAAWTMWRGGRRASCDSLFRQRIGRAPPYSFSLLKNRGILATYERLSRTSTFQNLSFGESRDEVR